MSLVNVDSKSQINLENVPSVRFTRSLNSKLAIAEGVRRDSLLNKGLIDSKRSRLPTIIQSTGSEEHLIRNADYRFASVDAHNPAKIDNADAEVPIALIVDIETRVNTDTKTDINNTNDNLFYDNSIDVSLPIASSNKSAAFLAEATSYISNVVKPQDLSLTTRIKNFLFGKREKSSVNPTIPLEKHFLNSTTNTNENPSVALDEDVADLSNIVHFDSNSLLFNEFESKCTMLDKSATSSSKATEGFSF